MKRVVEIQLLTSPLKNFWANTAYRIPKALFPVVQRFVSQEPLDSPTTPITDIVVNSLITNLEDGVKAKAGQPLEVKGIARDGGYGIAEVALSIDDGMSWIPASLSTDLGRFSWRQWTYRFTPAKVGTTTITVRARNGAGATQVDKLLFNAAGYHNNIAQKLAIHVV